MKKPHRKIEPAKRKRSKVLRAREPKSLVQFFRESPLVGLELEFDRDRDSESNDAISGGSHRGGGDTEEV
jgi:hypothetical protein